MIRSIYAEVSNGNQVSCGKRHPKYQSVPIPLMKSNYLSEFRTQLEKAKARRNLGIGDEYTLSWGNIQGHIEDNTDLVNFIENQWKYNYVSPYIQQEIKNVKEALDYALYYVSTYEANDQAVTNLSQQFDLLLQQVNDFRNDLQQGINNNAESISNIEEAIDNINQSISDLNDAIENIDVDRNIENWIRNNLSQSGTIEFYPVYEPVFDDEGEPVIGEDGEQEQRLVLQIIEVKISQDEENGLTKREDGLYVKSYDRDVQNINEAIQDINQTQKDINNQLVDLKYNTELPDSTTSPVHEGVTVEQLKNKSLSEILDEVIFPAEVRELIEPTIEYSDIETLVEKGSPIYYPQVEYLAGDAGETVATSNVVMFNGQNYEGDYYDQVGTYIFTAIVQYDDGEYLKNNREETTNLRIEAGAVSVTKSVKVTYPWYAGSTENGVTKQELVPINEQSGILDFPLSGHAIVKLPGENTQISSFRVDSGLSYLDVDMDGWAYSTEVLNGITYRVWTKQDSYSAILPHRINFRINV